MQFEIGFKSVQVLYERRARVNQSEHI